MRVQSINVASAQTLITPQGAVQSAIRKRPVAEPVAVQALGLAGDEQADLSVHGGLSKAVYAYPSEHYPFWQTVRAQAKAADWGAELRPGSLGENLTLEGLLETGVWIGDRLCFEGGVELLVSEPRQPCFKFNAAMGFKQAAKLMAQSGYCGFYLAVKTEGSLSAGEAFRVEPGPRQVSIPELFRVAMRG
jgi:MOSC domain-containing protein YiiM